MEIVSLRGSMSSRTSVCDMRTPSTLHSVSFFKKHVLRRIVRTDKFGACTTVKLSKSGILITQLNDKLCVLCTNSFITCSK